MEGNGKAWYKRKEFWGPVIAAASALLPYVPDAVPFAIKKIFPDHTFIVQLAQPIGVVLGAVWTSLGLRKGYKADNLPSGLTKVMDKIPDSVTGVKGENSKPGGQP